MQRKLVTLVHCQLVEEEGRIRAMRAARSLGERTVTELILQHQNPQQLSSNLWAAVRARGCQFLGPGVYQSSHAVWRNNKNYEKLDLQVICRAVGAAASWKHCIDIYVYPPTFPHIAGPKQLMVSISCVTSFRGRVEIQNWISQILIRQPLRTLVSLSSERHKEVACRC